MDVDVAIRLLLEVEKRQIRKQNEHLGAHTLWNTQLRKWLHEPQPTVASISCFEFQEREGEGKTAIVVNSQLYSS